MQAESSTLELPLDLSLPSLEIQKIREAVSIDLPLDLSQDSRQKRKRSYDPDVNDIPVLTSMKVQKMEPESQEIPLLIDWDENEPTAEKEIPTSNESPVTVSMDLMAEPTKSVTEEE